MRSRSRANMVAALMLAVLAIAVGWVVATRPTVAHSGTAPTPTPQVCAGGGR